MLRKYAAGAALAAALVTGLTACSSTATADKKAADRTRVAPSPTPKPADRLATAVTRTRAVPVKFVVGDDSDTLANGGYDAGNRISAFKTGTGGDALDLVTTDTELYMSGAALEGQSIRMQIAKLKAESAMALLTDPVAGLSLLTGATEVNSSLSNTFTGTVDLTRVQATAGNTKKFIEGVLKASAGRTTLSFTAKTTAEGYLSEFSTALPGIADGKDGQYVMKLTDFGAPVTATRPANAIEAPAATYDK